MIKIAHRALLQGPDPELENRPDQIAKCLSQGYHVEVDVWYQAHTWHLGHDAPTYPISVDFLLHPHLWIHVKHDVAAWEMHKLRVQHAHVNFFAHDTDARVLTSQGYWWTYPGHTLGTGSVAVMPELHVSLTDLPCWISQTPAVGVCTDYWSLLAG